MLRTARRLALLAVPALLALGGCDSGDPDTGFTRAVITDITIEAVPARTPDGDTWDNDPTGITSDPDLFVDLLDSAGSLVFTSEEEDAANVDQSELPVGWQTSVTFNRFDRTLFVEVYDKDPNSTDFMAETETFRLQDLVDQGYRTFVSLESDDGATVVTLRLDWTR